MAIGTIGTGIAVALMMQAATPVADVAFEELSAQQNRAAIDKLEAASQSDDPAMLINLGIAYAREGQHELARELFTRATRVETRYRLETAGGEWVDSRWLAMRAIAMLDAGEFGGTSRMAAR